MAYTINMRDSAERHYVDACSLLASQRFDNAGYHFGFAAECAIKQKMLNLGLFTDEDAFWRHFPEMKAKAALAISGRRALSTKSLLNRASFMQHWDTDMRYSQNSSITQKKAESWKIDANDAIGLLYE